MSKTEVFYLVLVIAPVVCAFLCLQLAFSWRKSAQEWRKMYDTERAFREKQRDDFMNMLDQCVERVLRKESAED